VALAVHNHHDTLLHFPSSGNNGSITRSSGNPTTAGTTPFQQAGVLFQILPYLEQTSVYAAVDDTIKGTAVKAYYCPSRRPPTTRLDAGDRPLALNDYATPMWKDSSQGPGQGGNGGGCWNFWSDAAGDNVNHSFYRNTVLVRGGKASEAFPPGRIADVLDGTSNVILMAEKFVDPTRYQPMKITDEPLQAPWGVPLSFTDMGYFHGWNWSTMRCSMYGPIRDQRYASIAYWQMFGSAHPAGVQAAYADGSVRSIAFTVPNPLFQALCRKDDGLVIDLTGF
jgi:hypothetical protein